MINLDEGIKLYEDKIEYDIMIIESAETMPHSSVDYRSLDEYREKLATHKQVVEWLKELKEAKKLLKLAIEDLERLAAEQICFSGCDESCPFDCMGRCEEKHWKHLDEALKLIKENENG